MPEREPRLGGGIHAWIDGPRRRWNRISGRLPWLWPYGTLGLLIATIVAPAWITTDRLVIGGDIAAQQYPLHVLWRDLLASGEWPFWNSYVMGGMPALADPHAAFFYPPHWLTVWAPPLLALNWMIGPHLLLAGLGTAWCAGRLGATRSGQFLAGICFALGGVTTARLLAGNIDVLEAISWLPLATGVAVGIQRRRAVVLLAAILAMLPLVGRADVFVLAAWWLPLWAGLGALRDGWMPALRALIRVGIALGLGLGLAAVQIVPTARLVEISNRANGLSWEFAVSGSLPPWHLLGAFAPEMFGTWLDDTYWPGVWWGWHELLLYIGVAPLLAAMCARSAWRWVCWIAAAISVAIAFGHFVPWYAWLFAVVPGYDTFRVPGRHVMLTALALALALAAGLGLERLRGKRVFAVALTAAATLVIASLTSTVWLPHVVALLGGMQPLTQWETRAPLEQQALQPLQIASLIFLAVALAARLPGRWAPRAQLGLALLELTLVMGPYRLRPTDPRELLGNVAALRDFSRAVVLGDIVSPTLGPLIRVTQPGGYAPLFNDTYALLVTGAYQAGVAVGVGAGQEPILRMLGYEALIDRETREVTILSPRSPLAWVARCARPGGALEVRAPDFPRQQCVTLSQPSGPRRAVPAGKASLIRERPGFAEIYAEGPGWLFTTIPWYPGWSAEVDGSPASIEVLDGALVGVPLGAGSHTVTLRYYPAGLDLGLALSLLSGLALTAWWWWERPGRGARLWRFDDDVRAIGGAHAGEAGIGGGAVVQGQHPGL